MNRIILVSLFAVALTGCQYAPQAISINPKVDVRTSEAGRGQDLQVNVVDERPKKTLGTVGVGNEGADISIEGDMVDSVQRALNDGLSRMNFKPAPARNGSKSELRVEIRNLDYTIIRGFWAGTVRVDAGLKAICVRDGTRPYEKLHHGESIVSVQTNQSREANEQYINAALSAAINALLSDQNLQACIAQQIIP